MNRWTDGWTDGLTDRPMGIASYRLTSGWIKTDIDYGSISRSFSHGEASEAPMRLVEDVVNIKIQLHLIIF